MNALSGKLRTQTGRSSSRQARRDSMLPAVLYGLKDNLSFVVNPKDLKKILTQKGDNALIDLNIDGDTTPQRTVVLKDWQDHPLREGWVHVDFLEIAMDKKIRVEVPVILKGHSPGEKLGGLINHVHHFLNVECLPKDIPTSIDIDMEKIQLGQVLHVGELPVSDGVKILYPDSEAVVSVYLEKVKEEKPAAEVAVAPGADKEAAPKKEGK